jgi:hypothetical protein
MKLKSSALQLVTSHYRQGHFLSSRDAMTKPEMDPPDLCRHLTCPQRVVRRPLPGLLIFVFARACVCDERAELSISMGCDIGKTGTQGVSFQVKVRKSETNKTVGQGRHTVKKETEAKASAHRDNFVAEERGQVQRVLFQHQSLRPPP